MLLSLPLSPKYNFVSQFHSLNKLGDYITKKENLNIFDKNKGKATLKEVIHNMQGKVERSFLH